MAWICYHLYSDDMILTMKNYYYENNSYFFILHVFSSGFFNSATFYFQQ